MCGGVWECGKPIGFSIFPCPGARGKRGGDFLLEPPLAALFGSPFPPVRPLKPQYIWDNYYDVPQTIYYLEENTREMTEEEKADFRADRKVFSQRYVKLIADERERLRKKARETE